MSKKFYEVSVPVTITVFIEGDDLTEEEAADHAARYTNSIAPSEMESKGYSSVAFAQHPAAIAITRAEVDISGPPNPVDTTADQD